MTLVVGVDGGGTHTRALIVNGEGRELARAEATGAVVDAAAPGRAAGAVTEAVRRAAEDAGVDLPVDAMWAGLAGAGLGEGRSAVAAELAAAGLARRVVVGTDVEAAFHAAFGDGPGVLLIAGTGSIAWARNAHGDVVRVGGWGDRLGDEGSGFALGMGALRAIARGKDGRGPETSLERRVLERLSLQAVEGLVPWAASATKAEVAALVPLVARAAEEGDRVAAALMADAVTDLCAHLHAVLDRAGPWPEPPGLVLWGGLLTAGGSLHEAMAQAVGDYPARLSSGDIDPAFGAANLALATLAAAGDEA